MRPHDFAYFQEKIFYIDDHMGIGISGLTADARYLCKYMRNECLNYQYVHENAHPTQRLIEKIAKKSQVKTCSGSKRPYGVGLLIAGYDETGSHLFETCPSANYYEYHAMAIGARCQSAKTYLEKHFAQFKSSGWEELVRHGLKALKASAQETVLDENNISIGVVGKDMAFR
jgi:20S proteasome subunit alpha 6